MTQLGKRFKEAINATRDQNYINRTRRRLEEVKLTIMDAAENGETPPIIEEAAWIYSLYNSEPLYAFLANEFSAWLEANGITFHYTYQRSKEVAIKISPGRYTNWDDIEVFSPKEMVDNVFEKIKRGE